MKRALCIAALLVSQQAVAWSLFGPNSFEDCVLDGLKTVQVPPAITVVRRACNAKFPVTMSECHKMSEREIRDRGGDSCYEIVDSKNRKSFNDYLNESEEKDKCSDYPNIENPFMKTLCEVEGGK